LNIAIAVSVGRVRAATGITAGDGGNSDLIIAMRRHANFTEYAPLTLVIIALLEMNGAPAMAIHILAGGLVVARISHAIGMNGSEETSPARFVGTVGTTLVLLVASVWAIVLSV
jgi:uncharacterized membrane protein YecN with MAPEG domain